MSLPSVETVRKRIQKAHPEEAKYCLMTAYLFCGRVSEVIGRICPSDTHKTTARGPTGKDIQTDIFELGPIKEEVTIFTVNTAKREGLERKIALPLNPKYEPWTEELYNYFKSHGSQKVFPFTRQKATAYANKAFKGLTYPVYKYKIWENGKVVKEPKFHNKPFRTHALRHLRATELLEYYGFTGIDLSIYGGWTLKSMVGIGSAMERYAHLNWRQYFPKLLKEKRN